MTFNSRRAMPRTASGAGDVRAAGESPVPLRADPFNGAGGVVAGRDRCPRSPEPPLLWVCHRCEMIGSEAEAEAHMERTGHAIESVGAEASAAVRVIWALP